MSRALQNNPAFTRLCKQLPPDIFATFSIDQLTALEDAITQTWRNHPIDVRLTIPLLWQKFYVVVVAGPERRSKERLKEERDTHPIWKPSNLIFIILIISLAIGLIVGVMQLNQLNQNFSNQADFPTSVPFKENKQECENSGRTWQNNQCIDYEHDSSF
ncbi:MAG: hypothetical protein AAGA75_28710 [Cyanobacteria bacterium P01_E01_bin.6]